VVSAPGQFAFPAGIAVDRAGNVYVVDAGNHRIQKLSPAGEPLAQWGREGTAPGEFRFPAARTTPFGLRLQSPVGIGADQAGNVFVADPGNLRIQKLSAHGDVLAVWPTRGTPSGIAVDPDGNLFVADAGSNLVQKFSSQGDPLAQWGNESFLGGFGGSGSPVPRSPLPSQPPAPGQFQRPAGIAVDQEGNLYVADAGNNRIQKLSPMGRPLAQWGSLGRDPGQFNAPDGVAIDRAGNVYVADTDYDRIQKLSRQGEPVAMWGVGGSGAGQFARPAALAVDGEGNVYVADTLNHRIQKLAVSSQRQP
jgi:DNA-binding beta-propeller fold protein YncE